MTSSFVNFSLKGGAITMNLLTGALAVVPSLDTSSIVKSGDSRSFVYSSSESYHSFLRAVALRRGLLLGFGPDFPEKPPATGTTNPDIGSQKNPPAAPPAPRASLGTKEYTRAVPVAWHPRTPKCTSSR